MVKSELEALYNYAADLILEKEINNNLLLQRGWWARNTEHAYVLNDLKIYIHTTEDIDADDAAQIDELTIRRCLYRGYGIALSHSLYENNPYMKPLIIKRCTCGAKYTSFPNHHYDWCDIK